MGDDIGARVRAVPGLPEVVADLLGDGLGFGCVEDNDQAMEWALRAYRAGQAATPGGPRRWQLPDEPGPEVTALNDAEGWDWKRRAGGGWCHVSRLLVHVHLWYLLVSPRRTRGGNHDR